uniref:Protein containing DDE Tnp 4 domain n=1 Tax=Rhipicephalus zambeziensis TaxID=60191 RepID=A0A224YQ81_9ACAR
MTSFNKVHSKQRVVVECAFGILKARFQRLLYLDVTDIEQAVRIVIGACVLHNVARSGDTVEGGEVADTGTDVSSTDPIDDPTPAVSAAAMRDTLAQSLQASFFFLTKEIKLACNFNLTCKMHFVNHSCS